MVSEQELYLLKWQTDIITILNSSAIFRNRPVLKVNTTTNLNRNIGIHKMVHKPHRTAEVAHSIAHNTFTRIIKFCFVYRVAVRRRSSERKKYFHCVF